MSRIIKVQKELEVRGLDAILVTNLYNLRYTAGFTGTTGLAVITTKKCYFITDARYTEQASNQCVGFEIIQNIGPIFNEVKKLVTQLGIKKLGIEDGTLSVAQYHQLTELLSAQLVSATGLIEKLRELKEPAEFEIIKKATAIADKAFDYILGEIKPGITEIDVANKMDFYMRSLGASGVSFDTIVASGIRSALPHGVASSKVLEMGDFITLDYGCYFEGYVSDMTRTISLGEPRHKQLKEIHDIVLNAQELVNHLGKSKSAMSRWIKGDRSPMVEDVERLAELFQTDIHTLLYGFDKKQKTVEVSKTTADIIKLLKNLTELEKERLLIYATQLTEERQKQKNILRFPVQVIEAVAAGVGYSYGNDNTVTYFTDRDNLKHYDFASAVSGNSMEPMLSNGDIVLIKKNTDFISGSIYVVDYNDKSFVKKVYFEKDNLRLVSLNEAYDDIIIPRHTEHYLNIVGLVVDWFTPIP